jgi:hypothetical protein
MKLSYPFVSIFKVVFSTIIMGIVMEIIILHNREMFGFIASIVCGMAVYIVSALVLGTFEKEDYILLENLSRVLPGKSKRFLDGVLAFVGHFKPGRENDKSL